MKTQEFQKEEPKVIKSRETVQTKFSINGDNNRIVVENGISNFSDPAFSNNKLLPIHRWVPWIAGFSSKFVTNILNKRPKNITVLDPFVGVGTTLIEAFLSGSNVIGFEINPYACYVCKVKTFSYQINNCKLKNEINRFIKYYKKEYHHKPIKKPPQGFKTRVEFYSPNVMRKVLLYFDFIEAINSDEIKDLFKLAFSSTMVSFSNYSYEPSLGTRIGSGKANILDYPVFETILNKLLEFHSDIKWYKKHLPDTTPEIKIIRDSFFNLKNYLNPESIDLVITSPPYVNNYHYNRNTRPQLFWLEFVQQSKDLKKLENLNFGKYWQTVRNSDPINLNFSIPESKLEEIIRVLRKRNPHKGIYGGKGWANYVTSYFNDCYDFIRGLDFALKNRGSAFIVLGNSIIQGIEIPTDIFFAEIAHKLGLEVIKIDIPREKRIGNSTKKTNKSATLYEAVIELQKN
jgi:DNA modification methylase